MWTSAARGGANAVGRRGGRSSGRPVACLGVLALLAGGAGLTGCGVLPAGAPATIHVTAAAPSSRGAPPSPSPRPDVTFTIGAAGDVLTHEPLLRSARAGAGYDFTPLLAGMNAYVAGVDLALCHLEVPLAPAGSRPSGYPVFGAPDALVPALKAQGWDGCSTASNHSADRAWPGVEATLNAFDAAGLGHDGTARSAAEAAAPQLYTLARNGRTITVAHISATYGLNGLPVPAGRPWSIRLIDTESVIAESRAARAAGADLVVVSIHAGTEYVTAPTAQQLQVDAALAASGQVDLIIGHHAHVPQPIVRLPGGPDGQGVWTAYGLGNFISNQDSACCNPKTDSGLFLTATVTVPWRGPARVTGVDWTAVTVDRRAGHRVAPIHGARAQSRGTLSAGELGARYGRLAAAVGAEAPERTEPPTPSGPAPLVVRRGAAG